MIASLFPPSLGSSHLLHTFTTAQTPITQLAASHTHSITYNKQRIQQAALIHTKFLTTQHTQKVNDTEYHEIIQNAPKPIAIFDGTHSPTHRIFTNQKREFKVEKYAVYYGRRRAKSEEDIMQWREMLVPKLLDHKKVPSLSSRAKNHDGAPNSNVLPPLQRHRPANTNILLQIFLNSPSELAYTYSRPALTEGKDPLFHPDRPLGSAHEIPEELYAEIASMLTRDNAMPTAFREVFGRISSRNDRILNWLMRSDLLPKSFLEDLVRQGIYLGGDAVHPTPLIGSYGAEEAIKDAEEMIKGLDGYVDRCYPRWEQFVKSSVDRLHQLHA